MIQGNTGRDLEAHLESEQVERLMGIAVNPGEARNNENLR